MLKNVRDEVHVRREKKKIKEYQLKENENVGRQKKRTKTFTARRKLKLTEKKEINNGIL